MSGEVKRTDGTDLVYEAVDANLAAGVLVIPSTTATSDPSLQGIKVATDAAVNCLGVSAKSCITAANRAAAENTTDATSGVPVVDLSLGSSNTTVYNSFTGLLNYTAVAVLYGAKLAAAANGGVRAWVTGDGPAAIVGWCAQPGGVSSAGGRKLARILL